MKKLEVGVSQPMVSVAMVTYNQENLIAKAIKGVVRQRVPFQFELIIVDDDSPDNTYAIATSWQKRYPDIIKVFRNSENIGLQKNYLRAFSHCRGRYLAMCDADDYWCDHSKLRRQIEYMESHPECAITFHRVINHYAGAGTKSLSNPHQPSDCGLAELSRGNFITNCSVIYRRNLVNLNALPQWITEDVWPDYPIHMLYAAHGSIHYSPRPMAVYRQGGTGAWTAAGEYRRQRKALVVRKHLLQQFSGYPEATAGLRIAIHNILEAMVRCAPSDTARKEALTELADNFNLSQDDIKKITDRKPRRRNLTKRLLTTARKIISWFIPLPRP